MTAVPKTGYEVDQITVMMDGAAYSDMTVSDIENTDNITKIILGQGWNSGKLTIYHSFGKKETLYITEGMFKIGELERYIKENGYNLDNIGFTLIGISGLIMFYLFVCKYVNKKR